MTSTIEGEDPILELRALAAEVHGVLYGHITLLMGANVSIARIDNSGSLVIIETRTELGQRHDKGPLESIAAMLWNVADKQRAKLARDIDDKRAALAEAERQLASMDARIERLKAMTGQKSQPEPIGRNVRPPPAPCPGGDPRPIG